MKTAAAGVAHKTGAQGVVLDIPDEAVLAGAYRDLEKRLRPHVRFALPPFDAACARRRVDSLRFRDMLDGVRGAPAVDIDGFCDVAARFSVMVNALSGQLDEIDLNPVIVTANRCIAVDALVVNGQKEE